MTQPFLLMSAPFHGELVIFAVSGNTDENYISIFFFQFF